MSRRISAVATSKATDGPKRFKATLPLPPSINRTYHAGISKSGKAVFFADATAKAWAETAHVLLLAAGWRRLPKGSYALAVEYTIYCSARRDIDSVCKLLCDTIAQKTLGVDDRYITDLSMKKVIAPTAKHHVEVSVVARSA